MNIFSRFFELKSEKKKNDQVDLEGKHPNFNYKLEFLQALDKSPTSKLFGLNSYWEDRYKELVGDLKPIIKDFYSQGYLVESLKEESLSLKELKIILQKNGLPTSGKKEELARRVSENVTEKSFLKDLNSFLKVTEKGKQKIGSYKEKFDIEYLEFLKFQANLFGQGELQRFISNHFKVKSAFPDQRSIGLDSDILSEKTKKILQHLRGKKELRLLSGFSNDLELKVRSVLGILAIKFGLPFGFAEEYLIDLDVLRLKELSKNFIDKDSGIEINEYISNYLFFEYNTIWNFYTLEELKEVTKSKNPKNKFFGVQILNDGCRCQEKFGIEKYTWKDLDRIPVLPRSLDCKCIYNAYRVD